jgi:ADP-ribose pyrophosphatase
MNKIKQVMTKKDVKINLKAVLHDGFCHIERYEMRHKLFKGDWTPAYIRELMIKPSVAAAVPYDPRHNKVVLIEQFRVGALGKNTTPWLIEIVAGIMDQAHKENHEELIQREMREETCLDIEALLPIYDYLATPGCSTEKVKLFCAKVDSSKAPKFCGLLSEYEDIKIHVIEAREAFSAVRSGQINNAAAIIALQWLELNLENVNQKWSGASS